MAETTGISWTDATFNPWRGCTKVSAGCANCYAETLSKRNPGTLGIWGPTGKRVVAAESYWKQPLKWNAKAAKAGTRLKVFCASLADMFEKWDGPMHSTNDEVLWVNDSLSGWREEGETFKPKFDYAYVESQGWRKLTMDDVRNRWFKLTYQTPFIDWLLLTKRIERVRENWPRNGFPEAGVPGTLGKYLYLENVWLGTSTEDQATANERVPELVKCDDLCPILWLSAEPLLGPIVLPKWHVDWVIAGGESGGGARECAVEWNRSLREQCAARGIKFFMKQLGKVPTMALAESEKRVPLSVFGNPIKDAKGGDIEEWPDDLKVQEFPIGAK